MCPPPRPPCLRDVPRGEALVRALDELWRSWTARRMVVSASSAGTEPRPERVGVRGLFAKPGVEVARLTPACCAEASASESRETADDVEERRLSALSTLPPFSRLFFAPLSVASISKKDRFCWRCAASSTSCRSRR